MPIRGKVSGGGDYKRLSPGSHIAVCDLIADLGIQESNFGSKQQIYIRYEVPAERVEYEKDGKRIESPVVIGKTYTLSMHAKANLRKDLESWRGRKFTDEEAENFDISSLLGKPCMLSIVENFKDGKIYSNIEAISGLPKGTTKPKNENLLICYDGSNVETLKALPEWLQKKIKDQIPQKEEQQYDDSDDSYYDSQARSQDDGFQADNSDVPF